MGDGESDFDDVLQRFYLAPDVDGAVRAFERWLQSRDPSVTMLHGFTRMAMVSSGVRQGIEGLRSHNPRLVDAVLTGFDDPSFPRVEAAPPSCEELDLLWVEFFATGSLQPVARIAAVLDEPDRARARLSTWLRENGTGFFARRRFERFLPVFARCGLPIEFETSSIGGPLDVDLSVALAVRAASLKFAELPIQLTQEELLRLAAKSAALWSLRTVAHTHPLVAKLCRDEAVKPGGAARILLSFDS